MMQAAARQYSKLLTETNCYTSIPGYKYPVKGKYKHLEMEGIPRIPVADLEDSMRIFLEQVEPVLTAEEFAETKRKTEEFLVDPEAHNLYQEVLDWEAKSPTSYIEGFWDTSYLTFRVPFPCNINPAYGLGADKRGRDFIQRAASIVVGAVDFNEHLKNGTLPQDFEGKDTPLCMSQYNKLMGSTRIPRPGRDEYKEYVDCDHIIVCANDLQYRLDYVNEKGELYSEAEITDMIHKIYEDSKKGTAYPMGAFTSTHRDYYAEVYPKIRELNTEALEEIESALFVICLDNESDAGNETSFIKRLMVGNGRNRWFDKSIQFIVNGDARGGLNMEHSGFDGHSILTLFNHVCANEEAREIPAPVSTDFVPEAVEWKIDSELVEELKITEDFVDNMIETTHTVAFDFHDFAKEEIKKMKCNPDAFVQMALQLTYYKMHGVAGTTYESANTKRFYHGRTETIRSVSHESVAFTEAMTNPEASIEDKGKAFRAATSKHIENINLAKTGTHPDKILMVMRNIANFNINKIPDYQYPELLADAGYFKWITDLLSTSNVSGTPACDWFVFGPVTQSCFGCGYVISSEYIRLAITNFEGKSQIFHDTLAESLHEMKEVVEEYQRLYEQE